MAPVAALLALWAFVVTCMGQTGGMLVYSLDDPYIHLALAKNIQQGSYGINPGEWASPSSSIAWPFLLALAPASVAEWLPLIINGAACVLSVWCLARVIRRAGVPVWLPTVGALAVAFGLNLFGLVMTGMEHSLQVLLVVFVAMRLIEQRRDTWFYVALGLMPLIRYECLAISLPVGAYLWLTQDKVRPAVALGISLAIVAAFSAFLHAVGLPLLPSSVLAKTLEPPFMTNYTTHPTLVMMLAWLAYAWRDRLGQWAMFIGLPTLAFMMEGRVGWMGRYEVFILAWLAMFVLASVGEMVSKGAVGEGRAAPALILSCAALALSFPTLWQITLQTPGGCQNVAQQQMVTARIARELGMRVAVNDMGLVALRSGQYVLDLVGLASPEVLEVRRHGQMTGPWIDELAARKGVEVAFIFDKWFPQWSKDWILVASVELLGPKVSAGESSVQLYARTPQAAARLHAVAQSMAADPNVPATIRLY